MIGQCVGWADKLKSVKHDGCSFGTVKTATELHILRVTKIS